MADVGHLKRICKDAFSVAGAVQETCSSEMLGGERTDFLRGVGFWSIRSGRRCILERWSGKIAKRIGTRANSSALNLPFLKEVSQNCFVFDVVKFRT